LAEGRPAGWSFRGGSGAAALVRARRNKQSDSKTLPVPAPAATVVPALRDRAASLAPPPSRRRRPGAARCYRAALAPRHRPGPGPR